MASKDISAPDERASRAQAATSPSTPAIPDPTIHDPAIPDPVVAKDANGDERPLSGGSFIRIDGKLVRQEA